MVTSHAATFAPHVQLELEAPQIRELSLLELLQVAGGLPHGGWHVVGPVQQIAALVLEPLPHGA